MEETHFTEEYLGTLLVTWGYDAQSHTFPIAFAEVVSFRYRMG